MWLPTHTYKCTSDTRLSLASLKPVPSEAQTSAHPLIPPTLPISATPNFCVCSPSVCFSTLLSLSRSLFLQVLVAFISFSETMLLVYLSYKVSHSHDPIGQPVCGGVCGGFGWISDAWWWWLSTGHFCCAIKVEVMVFCLSTIDHFYINF